MVQSAPSRRDEAPIHWTTLTSTIAVCFLFGNFYISGIDATNLLYCFFQPSASLALRVGMTHAESAILLFTQLMPFFMIATGFVLVLLFLSVRRAWWSIFRNWPQSHNVYTCRPIDLKFSTITLEDRLFLVHLIQLCRPAMPAVNEEWIFKPL